MKQLKPHPHVIRLYGCVSDAGKKKLNHVDLEPYASGKRNNSYLSSYALIASIEN